MNVSKKKKKNKFLIVFLIIISLVVIGSAIFFFTKNSSKNQNQTRESQSGLEEKKFFLMAVFNNPNFRNRHPYWGECLFTHKNTNTGFRISLDHPALKGVELKEKNFYLVEGIKLSSLNIFASKNKIGMSDKITITISK